jgi:hypothetical protein
MNRVIPLGQYPEAKERSSTDGTDDSTQGFHLLAYRHHIVQTLLAYINQPKLHVTSEQLLSANIPLNWMVR